MDIPHFIYPFIRWWTFGWFGFHFLANMNNATMNNLHMCLYMGWGFLCFHQISHTIFIKLGEGMAFSIHIWLCDSINTWFYFITQKSPGGIVNLGISKFFFLLSWEGDSRIQSDLRERCLASLCFSFIICKMSMFIIWNSMEAKTRYCLWTFVINCEELCAFEAFKAFMFRYVHGSDWIGAVFFSSWETV